MGPLGTALAISNASKRRIKANQYSEGVLEALIK